MAATGPGNRLPPDWNYSVTRDGRIFFINEVQRQTTWLHPLTGHTVQTGYERVKGLPMGWEHGYTPDGDLYFINHNDHKTTFEHPVTGSVSNKKLTFRDYGYPAPEAAADDKSPKPNSKSRNIKLQVPAAKRSPDAQVTRKGWLHRYESSGIGKKTWRKRWCVLAEYALFFYKDEKEKHSLGSILLPSYRINNCDSSDVVNKAFAFKIEHENTKTCYLAADSIDELNIWVRSVQEAAMLKGSPTFHREPNNNFTNFSKLNNMKLIPKSPIIVQHDDSDDEVPFFTKLSEWEKSWKSPGSYRKADEDLSPPQLRREKQPNGNHGPYPDDGYGEYTQIHPESRDNNGSNPNFDTRSGPNDPKSLPRDDPRQRFSGSDGSSPQGGGLQRWHNEPPQNLGSNRSIDPRYQSIASNRSDARQQRAPDQYGHNESQNHNNGRGSSRGDPRNSGSIPQNIQMSREQQRMSYDGAYSPKRAENQREAANRKDYPGRFIDTAYHPSLQNIPGPTQKPSDDRIFPEFKDRTQSQPNLTHPVDEHHRFGPPNDYARNQQAPIPKNRIMYDSRDPREPTRGPIAAPRSSRNPDMDNQRGSMSGDRERDIYSGNVGPHQQTGTQDPRNSYSGSNRGSLVGAQPNKGDIYSGNVGPNHQTRSQDPRNSYSGSNRGSLAGAQPNQRDSFPGRAGPQGDPSRERGSLAGQRNSFHGNVGAGAPRDSYSGSTGQRNSFHGGQHGNYPGGPVQEDHFRPDRNRESYASNRQRDSYPGSRNSLNYPEQKGRTQEQEMRRPQEQEMRRPQEKEMRRPPVAAPRRALSPDRNPGLTIDIPPNYINLPAGTHPGSQEPGSLDNGPSRPPYPAAFRQEMVEELAKEKTPRTSQQYLTSAENERKRMQQSPYFKYPNNQNQPQQNPSSRNSLPRDETIGNDNQKDGRWEDNSAQELRAAYERVQQLQHGQPPSDPNKDIYSTVNKKKAPPRKTFPMHTVKEDPNMSDRDIFTTTEIKNLNKKYPLNGSRIRMSISANDLIGKNHDELVLLLIQLRRNQAALSKARDYYKQHLESRRPNEKEYRKQRQNSPGAMDRILEEEHKNYTDLKHQMDEIENKLEVYKPIINLVDNMVTMGSLYGGDNLMLATQYRRHLLQPDQYTEPKDMIQFSRQRQENKMVEEIENEIKQLTDEEVDLEDKLERLYELDRRLQEQSFLVTSFSEDKEMLEKALQGILKQQDQKRDDPREMRALMHQQRTIEKELSRVTQQLAEASRLLEETTAENNKIDHEVALLRTKVHGELQRSRSAPSLVDDNERNKRKMEKELAKVQTMMSGLSKEGERLQEAMSTIRRSSSGANLAALLDKDEDKALKKAKTYMQTDIDSMETIDLSRQPKGAASMPNINMIEPESANQAYSSNYATMSSPMRTSATDQSDYVEMHSRSSSLIEDTDRARSKSLNELNTDVPPPPPRNFHNKPLISHQRQESSVAPPSEMYNSLGDGDDAWDIGDADDNTKRFYGLIPRERPKLLTVRDVKRQSEQRRERDKTRRGPDDLTDDAYRH
ncbi:uncharacterized protein LOC126823425 isoform X2 [Patella vulgata]|uniref:uncharacterized protein LOC126823425 isoform X2 n=1 Tax=Patella vulgata TaxID=6465 RepID=UPI0024A8B228|nr:uncharacterized protein LOC126823425 isoform X2 [Patella vulgata]